MSDVKAAGPKTDLVGVSPRMQQTIENLIANLAEGVHDCLENARHAVPGNDSDSARSSERHDAVGIAGKAAELIAAVAKLKGGFSHDYRVVRVNDTSADERALRAEKTWEVANMVSQAEVEDMDEEEYVDYHRKLKGLPPKYARSFLKMDRQVKALDLLQLATLEAEVERGSASPTPSPCENRGSNDEAGKS
jgi:hypothetical protein